MVFLWMGICVLFFIFCFIFLWVDVYDDDAFALVCYILLHPIVRLWWMLTAPVWVVLLRYGYASEVTMDVDFVFVFCPFVCVIIVVCVSAGFLVLFVLTGIRMWLEVSVEFDVMLYVILFFLCLCLSMWIFDDIMNCFVLFCMVVLCCLFLTLCDFCVCVLHVWFECVYFNFVYLFCYWFIYAECWFACRV
jgi:hypothetical protein